MAQIIPFQPKAAAGAAGRPVSTVASPGVETPAQLRDAIAALEQLDHNLQVEAHRISLAIGEIRRRRLALLKQLEEPLRGGASRP